MANQPYRPVIQLSEADLNNLDKFLLMWLDTVESELSTKNTIHLSAGSLAGIHNSLDGWLDKFCGKTLKLQDNIQH